MVSRAWCLLIAAGAVLVLPCAAPAQGTVSGRVTIQERPGEQSTDLGNTIIYLVPTDTARPRIPVANTSIAMNGRAFVPRVRVVTPGSRVDFPNQDPFSHNIFSTTAGAVFDLGLYPAGRSKDAQFRRAGAFPIYCNIHPRMTAFVIVTPTPYFAQGAADGRWTISGVPPGRYQARVWHERAPEVSQDIEVGAEGRVGVDAQLDARGFRFAQHRNKFGREYDRTGRERY